MRRIRVVLLGLALGCAACGQAMRIQTAAKPKILVPAATRPLTLVHHVRPRGTWEMRAVSKQPLLLLSICAGASEAIQHCTTRLRNFFYGLIPVNWIVRFVLRWLAFHATATQLSYVITLCNGVIPIAQSATQAVRLREIYSRACAEGACTPALQEDVGRVRSFLDTATQQALDSFLRAMDSDGDGTVTLAEALTTWEAIQPDDTSDQTDPDEAEPPAATLLEAVRRAQNTIDELERLRYGVELAFEGAVAAVDADGDGKVSFEEAVTAPGRIASWMKVWQGLVSRGKL